MTIRDRIAAILREHKPYGPCGTTRDGKLLRVYRCRDGWEGCDPDAHVADVLVRELALTQEHGLTDWSTATGHACTCDKADLADEWHSCERGQHGDESFPVTRYVTPWTAE